MLKCLSVDVVDLILKHHFFNIKSNIEIYLLKMLLKNYSFIFLILTVSEVFNILVGIFPLLIEPALGRIISYFEVFYSKDSILLTLYLTPAVCRSLLPGLLQYFLPGSLTVLQTEQLHPRRPEQQPARLQHPHRQQAVSEGGGQTGHSPVSL